MLPLAYRSLWGILELIIEDQRFTKGVSRGVHRRDPKPHDAGRDIHLSGLAVTPAFEHQEDQEGVEHPRRPTPATVPTDDHLDPIEQP